MKRYILLLAMAVIVIITVSACTCMRDAQHETQIREIKSPVKVHIITRGNNPSGKKPLVVPRWVILEYRENGQVEWDINDPDVNFTIRFDKDGCPFEKCEFNNKNNKTGLIVVDPGEIDRPYAYSLEVEGHDPIDPGIIIWKKN